MKKFCFISEVFGGFGNSNNSGTQSSGFGTPAQATPFGGTSSTLTFGGAPPTTAAPAFGAPSAPATTASGKNRSKYHISYKYGTKYQDQFLRGCHI